MRCLSRPGDTAGEARAKEGANKMAEPFARMWRGFLGVSLAVAVLGCGVTEPEVDLNADGVVRLMVAGSCWGIETTEGTFEPKSLDSEFLVDGLNVHITATILAGEASPCAIGPLIDVVSIEKISQGL